MKLDLKERKILYFLEMNATASISTLAKLCALRETTIRYYVDRLRLQGVLGNKRAFINSYALGHTHYVLYFSLQAKTRKASESFLSDIKKLPQVWWLAEVGSDFHYALSYSTSHISSLYQSLEELLQKHSVTLPNKALSIRLKVNRYSRKYLLSNKQALTRLTLGGADKISLDETDHLVLQSIAYRGEKSFRELAAEVAIPSSTYERRLKKLEQCGIVLGYFYEVDVRRFGRQQYLLHIRAKGVSKKLREQLERFAKSHPIVRKFVHCLGPWDFELEVNIAETEELNSFSSLLYEKFGEEIIHVSTVPLLRHSSTPPFCLSEATTLIN